MKKVLWVAWRELLATVLTKGFLVGVLVMPVILGVLVVVMPRLMNEKPPAVTGEVAVVDPTGEVAADVAAYLAPQSVAQRWGAAVEEAKEQAPEAVQRLMESEGARQVTSQAMTTALGQVPQLTVVTLPPGADLEAEKNRLRSTEDDGAADRASDKDAASGAVSTAADAAAAGHRLALVVIDPDAVEKEPGAEAYGSYQLYVREKLDDRVADEIQAALRQALIGARAAAQGLDPDEVAALTRVGRVRAIAVTAGGERESLGELSILIPMGFMILLLISVLTSGQYLMTTTIEEKSSRVVEVLLSAVSPLVLMSGKILGQMGVGLLILGLYAGMGLAALFSFALLGLLDPGLLLYLFLFYLIAFFTIASLMAAVGAAVNELREAQTLMAPIMLIVMIPWLLWLPITRDPNSALATTLSFVPPLNAFVMLLRMTSSTPPPSWQVWLSIAIGAAGVWGALWLAAKVFRVGLLMYGKPPDLKTLVRWVRMA